MEPTSDPETSSGIQLGGQLERSDARPHPPPDEDCNPAGDRDPDISEVSEEAHSVMVPLQPVSRPPPDIQLDMPPLASDSDTSDSGSSSGSGLHTVDGQNDDSADDAGDDAEFEVVYDDGDYDDGSNSEVDFFERIHHHIGEAAADSAPKVGCSHYERNCRMIAPCCGKEYWCRHCHNEAEESMATLTCVPPTSHTIDRYAVKEFDAELQVVCAQCSSRQPTSNLCTTCGIEFGKYFCSICNFWDDRLERNYYHCDGCGMCRVGGREKFVHCDDCGHCISRQSLEDGTHVHKPGSLKQDCPCCLEDLFTSTRSSQVLPCGHNVHVHCFAQYARSQPWARCPLCRKTALSDAHFRLACSSVDMEIARTPLSGEILAMFPNGVSVRCYDCSSVTQVPWHPFGLKCLSCGSYNTNPDG